VRQQPRREAKDAAAAILLSGDDGHEDDGHEDSDHKYCSGNFEKESPGCGTSLSADAGQNSHEVQEVSRGQENGNKLNLASVYSDSSERHGKATDVISGAKAKRARG
jgi:hypothetical protein